MPEAAALQSNAAVLLKSLDSTELCALAKATTRADLQRAVMLPGRDCQPRAGWGENRVAVKKDIGRAWYQRMKRGNMDQIRKRTVSEISLG